MLKLGLSGRTNGSAGNARCSAFRRVHFVAWWSSSAGVSIDPSERDVVRWCSLVFLGFLPEQKQTERLWETFFRFIYEKIWNIWTNEFLRFFVHVLGATELRQVRPVALPQGLHRCEDQLPRADHWCLGTGEAMTWNPWNRPLWNMSLKHVIETCHWVSMICKSKI